ncbi:MAG: hypothetical protein KatS3mg111_1607 [Pirellulaceae bacterium]|nr:MAG: hypothetical protein KatS3mg111_1607 [Pirellulaceae bacterium]
MRHAWETRLHPDRKLGAIPMTLNLTGKPAPRVDLVDLHGTVHSIPGTDQTWKLLVFHRHLG